MHTTGDQYLVKKINKAIVVDAIRNHSPLSRAQLSEMTGLNKGTVSTLVGELIEEQLVHEIGLGRSSGGRKPVMLVFNRSAGYAVGVDIGVKYLIAVLTDLDGQIVAERQVELERHEREQVVAVLTAAVRALIADAPTSPYGIVGAGVGVPGIVDDKGTVLFAPNLEWEDVDLQGILQDEFGFPFVVDNEANAGALGELHYGAGREAADIVYLSVSTGIGAGIVIGGRLYRGAGGTAGEIGHTAIEERGALCRCGNRGCLETLAGAPAIAALVARALGEEVTPEAVLARAAEGDPVCARALADAGRVVGIAVANLCNLTNPQRIVVGGTIGGAGEVLLSPLRDSVRLRAIGSAAADVEIVPGKLGQRAELLGAVALVLHQASPVQGARGYTAVSTA